MNRQSRASVKTAAVQVSLAAVLSLYLTARAEDVRSADIMPYVQQNAVVQKQCASCHSDALMYGGLSLEYFDAAHADPTLSAMLVSKITNGYSPREVKAASGPELEAKMLALIKTGAMTAGGPLPDDTTQLALVRALSLEAAGAEAWHSDWAENSRTHSRILTATILRQLPSTKFPDGRIDMYRLILTCRVSSHEGEIKLAWANGVPEEGREITVVVDGKTPFTHKIEGGKQQGNGANGPGATVLYPNLQTNTPFPAHSLTIRNVFPDETVVFPFEDLSQTVRQDLSTCFSADGRH
jgi:hypothetical protein